MIRVATPPTARMVRPAGSAGRIPTAVTMWASPVRTRASVITQRVGRSPAARSLMVERIGSYPGTSDPAYIQPPMRATGATTAETSPHHGTEGRAPARGRDGEADGEG